MDISGLENYKLKRKLNFPLPIHFLLLSLRQTLFIFHLHYYNTQLTDIHVILIRELMLILYFTFKRTYWNMYMSMFFSLETFSFAFTWRITPKLWNTLKAFTECIKKYISGVYFCLSSHFMSLTCKFWKTDLFGLPCTLLLLNIYYFSYAFLNYTFSFSF